MGSEMCIRDRGLGALRGILGSVSSYVLRNADVPVLIVKEGTNE